MSSDLSVFDASFYRYSSSDMASPDVVDLEFLSDPFSPFSDSLIDILQSIPDHPNQQSPVDKTHYLDQTAPTLLSSSLPSHQMENLSLCPVTNASSSANGFADFSGLDVKTEQCQVGFGSSYNQPFVPHSYDGTESASKILQRSYSSHSFDGKPGFLFHPRFDTLMESPSFQTQVMSSPENSFSTGQIRRVCSTGDLQKIQTNHTTHRFSSSPLASEGSCMEDVNFKVARYSAEERKERIHRYRAKRTQRNFNKTIKYACRKTLADNRPRIRGRFARNDETGEIPKAACFNPYEEEDDLWMDGFNEEDDEGTVLGGGGGSFMNSFGPNQFQYYGFS